MKKQSSSRRFIVSVTMVSVLLSACATNPDGSLKRNPDGTLQIDEKAKVALIGAAAGCGVAVAAGKDCVTGAVIGAVAGFLIGWYFESKKVASAEQVNKEYKKKGVKVARDEIRPVSFSSNVKTAPPTPKGEKEVQITANTDLIGYGDKVPVLQQKYAIYDDKDKLVETKTEKIAAVDGAGRYQTQSKFKLPAAARGKQYRVETTLLSDNKAVKSNKYQVSFLDDGRFMVAGLN
ncbi:MAG: hypothetical protein PHP85_04695 [Gallionella sp.]|nr:hypothetical protein [Gallionella sp.]